MHNLEKVKATSKKLGFKLLDKKLSWGRIKGAGNGKGDE